MSSTFITHFHTQIQKKNKTKNVGLFVCLVFFSLRIALANIGEEVSAGLISPLILSSVGGVPTHLPHHQPHLCNSSPSVRPRSEPIIDASVVATMSRRSACLEGLSVAQQKIRF